MKRKKKKKKKRLWNLNKYTRNKKEEDKVMTKVIAATVMKTKVKMKGTLAMMEKTRRKLKLANLKLMIWLQLIFLSSIM